MSLFPDELIKKISKNGVVAGFSVESATEAVSVAKALLDGGITAIELTLRTDAAMEGVGAVCREVPEMITGVGTILTPDQARQVKEAGAAFGVAPGMNPDVIKACRDLGLPFAPGIQTASELEAAVALGCRFVKFFPAEAAGGVVFLKSMSTPYAHLGLRYFPLGGVTQSNMNDYLALKNVPVVGGSWIVQRELVEKRDWKGISSRAEAVIRDVHAIDR